MSTDLSPPSRRDSGIVPATRPTLTDLLHPKPAARVERRALRRALVFAFASGDPGGGLLDAVDAGEVPDCDWNPAYFADDIFLRDVVERCLKVRVEGQDHEPCRRFLARALAHAPKDSSVTHFRQAIFRELDGDPSLYAALQRLYAQVSKLLDRLCCPDMGSAVDAQRRRFDVLRAIVELPDCLQPFQGSETGLQRLGELGEWMRGEASFARLKELIDYEGGAAEVELRLRLGHDGEIRQLTPLALRENDKTEYDPGAFRRFVSRLRMFFRGYPVRANEVLGRYVDEVFTGLEEPLLHVLQLRADLDFYLAGLGLKQRAEEAGLSMCLPELLPPGSACRFERLFNPLLFSDGVKVVPCDLELSSQPAIAIVTGPNSGGKTRLLQSIAHSQVLAQAGMYVPAAEAQVPWAEGLFVSLIAQASADESEGRLGTELIRIRHVFEQLRVGSLVLLDELCSGTNPSEGEEIFRLVVDLLQELRPRAFITTHFLSFAEHLSQDCPQLTFLQVALDGEERPTYQFSPGVARTSLAQRTARRLGVTAEQLRDLMLQNNPELRVAEESPEDEIEPRREVSGLTRAAK